MEQAERVLKEFLDLCRVVTDNDEVVIELIQKRYNRTNPHFLWSDKFLETIARCTKSLHEDPGNKFVHIRELTTELKLYTLKPLKHLLGHKIQNVAEITNSCDAAVREEDMRPLTSAAVVKSPVVTKKELCYNRDVIQVSCAEKHDTESSSKTNRIVSEQNHVAVQKITLHEAESDGPHSTTASSKHDTQTDQKAATLLLSPRSKLSLRSKLVAAVNAHTKLTLPGDLNDSCPNDILVPDVDKHSSMLKADSVTVVNGNIRRVSLNSCPLVMPMSDTTINGKIKGHTNVVISLSKNNELESPCIGEKNTDKSIDIAMFSTEQNDLICPQEGSKKTVAWETNRTGACQSESNRVSTSRSDNSVKKGRKNGEVERENGDGVTRRQTRFDGQSTSEAAPSAKKEQQIQRLEKLLERITHEIQKLSEMELGLDDMDNEDTPYLLEAKYKLKLVKVWKKICELKGCDISTGRVAERRVKYEGTKYPALNIMISHFVNKRRDVFPDYADVHRIIIKCNDSKHLGIRPSDIDRLARSTFVDLGEKLKKKRVDDLIQNMGCHLTDSLPPRSDPALSDPTLRRQLDENKKSGDAKLEKVLTEFAIKQDAFNEHSSDEDNKDENDDDDEEEEEEDVSDEMEIDDDDDLSKLVTKKRKHSSTACDFVFIKKRRINNIDSVTDDSLDDVTVSKTPSSSSSCVVIDDQDLLLVDNSNKATVSTTAHSVTSSAVVTHFVDDLVLISDALPSASKKPICQEQVPEPNNIKRQAEPVTVLLDAGIVVNGALSVPSDVTTDVVMIDSQTDDTECEDDDGVVVIDDDDADDVVEEDDYDYDENGVLQPRCERVKVLKDSHDSDSQDWCKVIYNTEEAKKYDKFEPSVIPVISNPAQATTFMETTSSLRKENTAPQRRCQVAKSVHEVITKDYVTVDDDVISVENEPECFVVSPSQSETERPRLHGDVESAVVSGECIHDVRVEGLILHAKPIAYRKVLIDNKQERIQSTSTSPSVTAAASRGTTDQTAGAYNDIAAAAGTTAAAARVTAATTVAGTIFRAAKAATARVTASVTKTVVESEIIELDSEEPESLSGDICESEQCKEELSKNMLTATTVPIVVETGGACSETRAVVPDRIANSFTSTNYAKISFGGNSENLSQISLSKDSTESAHLLSQPVRSCRIPVAENSTSDSLSIIHTTLISSPMIAASPTKRALGHVTNESAPGPAISSSPFRVIGQVVSFNT